MSDWPTDNFPPPNPYFPDPPRPRWWFGLFNAFFVLIAAALLVGVSLVIIHHFENLVFGWVMALWFAAAVLVVVAALIARDTLKTRVWRTGRIVPARIIKAPKSEFWFVPLHMVMLLLPGLGALVSSLLNRITREHNSAKVVTKVGPRTIELEVLAARHWKRYTTRLDVWVLLNDALDPFALEIHAPRSFRNIPVPQEASDWLDIAIAPEFQQAAEFHKSTVLETELRRAANANTKALKTNERYEKRPS